MIISLYDSFMISYYLKMENIKSSSSRDGWKIYHDVMENVVLILLSCCCLNEVALTAVFMLLKMHEYSSFFIVTVRFIILKKYRRN